MPTEANVGIDVGAEINAALKFTRLVSNTSPACKIVIFFANLTVIRGKFIKFCAVT